MYLYNISMLKGKSIIFVDFFDTVMFRYIHSSQLLEAWAKAMNKKYPDISKDIFVALRKKYRTDNECAVAYSKVISDIFDEIEDKLNCSLETFYDISLNLDISLDQATQYPNNRIIRKLRKAKQEGKKIYLITDFYLPTCAYEQFLKFYDLYGLFDDIYCSSDIGKTKSDGDLYSYVLSDIGCNSDNCLMVGDSKKSDCINPKKVGITGVHYFPLVHKIATNVRKIIKLDYANVASKIIFKKSLKHTMFAEYGVNLFVFAKKLKLELTKDNIGSISFLSRGGYCLKKAFDTYQKYDSSKKIITHYIYSSRKVNYDALDNEVKRQLFFEYMMPYVSNNDFAFVDEGWYGNGQDALHKFTMWNIKGYYLGLLRNKIVENDLRKGILFGIDSKGNKSHFFGIFRTNLTFYEQILTAPHGSVKGYEKKQGTIEPILDYKNVEEKLYKKFTKTLQDKMLLNESGMIAWNAKVSDYQLSKYMLKSLLFGNDDRIKFLQVYDSSYYDNLNATEKKEFGRLKDLKINVIDFIFNPENYMRYFCKIKEKKSKFLPLKICYPIISYIIYLYCLGSISLKNLFYR